MVIPNAIAAAISEHIKAVHISPQPVSHNGIVAAGRKEVYAVGSIAIGLVVGDEVVVGVGEVYAIPAFTHYPVKAGIVAGDDISI
jgi:hypothetical protein